jgi:hypothetical protein
MNTSQRQNGSSQYDDDVIPYVERPFPKPMSSDAFIGLPGKIVSAISPTSEASREAMLIELLVSMGNIVGREPLRVQAGRHRPVLFAMIVGNSSKSRKGTSWLELEPLLATIDSPWLYEKVQRGLNSGRLWLKPLETRTKAAKFPISKINGC